jgi:hypothetical protein
MKLTNVFLISFLILVIPKSINAQTDKSFKPGGKPEARIFSNFNAEFSDGKNVNRFELTRAYLGYTYNFCETLYGRITYDVGNPSVGKFQMAALLKFAYLQYRKNKLTITSGMIPTTIFDLADKKWGYRYIYKSFQDEYGLSTSADLGISGEYVINKWLSADAILVNGEGYKQMDSDSVLKGGIGLTFLPVKSITVRGYIESMKKGSADQLGYSLLASYEHSRFNLNAEFNHQDDHNLVAGQSFGGISIYGTVLLKKNLKLFARFDQLKSDKLPATANPGIFLKMGSFISPDLSFHLSRVLKFPRTFSNGNQTKLEVIPFQNFT